ncbi:MAG: hypothetical protein JWQ67_1078 [Marmoricola sp.]|nr:hypothetical protein [Marmoricola sp.]
MRTVRPRHAAAWIVVAVLFSVLTGCGGAPAPEPLPKPSGSTSPSASASATPGAPVMPGAARAKTKAGAIAFAHGFIEALNFSGTHGDTRIFRNLYIPLCTRCEAIADGIDQTYARGGYFRGGEWRPTRFKFYAIENDVAVLDAVVTYEPQTWVKQSGAKPTIYSGSENNLKAFNLRWRAGEWHVSALDPTT